jgi:medium-chain acyl-[acyl-carrier-protein] hydrolase
MFGYSRKKQTPSSTGTLRTSWCHVRSPNPTAELRLLCFPYAGGGASVFSGWARSLPPHVELCAVQMPGREERIGDHYIIEWEEVVERLAQELSQYLDRPFAIFGHSLGAILAFEFIRHLRAEQRYRCSHLFVSGRRAPHLPPDDPPTYDLPDTEFVEELRRLAGTPGEVLERPELMEVLLPLLRADFRLSETYVFKEGPPLDLPITVYGGMDDKEVSVSELEAWQLHTNMGFQRVMFPGGHFFVTQHRSVLLSQLGNDLQMVYKCLKRQPCGRTDQIGASRPL